MVDRTPADFEKLKKLYLLAQRQLHQLTLQHNRAKHENRVLKAEVEALKRRMRNG